MWKRGWIRAAQFLSTQQSFTPFLSLFCSIWRGRSSCVWIWEQGNLAITLHWQKAVLPLSSTLRDFVRDIDPHFHVKTHTLLAPHDCTSARSLPEREGGLKLGCGFLALGNCSGCPKSTMFRQADCFWGQRRDSLCLLTVNTSRVPGHKGGRCKSPSSSGCWIETHHQTGRVLHKSLLIFSLLWVTLITTTTYFSIRETWDSSFLLAK